MQKRRAGIRYYKNKTMLTINAQELAKRRVTLGKSQIEFAELAGVNVAVVRRAEQGRERIREENARAIADVHKERVEDLFSYERPATIPEQKRNVSALPDYSNEAPPDAKRKYS